MKRIVILGGGTAGTMMANKLIKKLDKRAWHITVVDKDKNHYYQPGFLFIPFSIYKPKDVVKPKSKFFPSGVDVLYDEAEKIDPDAKTVRLQNGTTLSYDILIVATGTSIHPEETEGLLGDQWHKSIFDFYTPEGAEALGKFFSTWQGGKLVLNFTEMPIKCPVAPLEFLFLADAYFTQRGIRDKVEIQYATPLSGAFTKPVASAVLGNLMEKKNIKLIPDFAIERADPDAKAIVSYDDTKVDYDVLVTIPTNMGSTIIEASGLGDELGFVPTNKHTLRSEKYDDIFVIGDATNLPASKAGSVSHFEGEILAENLLSVIAGGEPTAKYDGHANCFIESGFGKGFLIDFNYEIEPLPGQFPVPGLGPFSLLKETKMNHLGKMAFKWVYWNMLIKGVHIPMAGAEMRLAGKQKPADLIQGRL